MSVDVQREAVQAQIDRLRRSPAKIAPVIIQWRQGERARAADLAAMKLDWF